MNPNDNQSYVIVASKKDPASMNIAQTLISQFGFRETEEQFEEEAVFRKDEAKLIFLREEATTAEHLKDFFSPSFYVFVSRHTSSKGIPSLTTHFPGNFSEDYSRGGRPLELAYTYPSLLKDYFKRLSQRKNEASGYEVAIEATHHGPTSLDKPVLYVEIGSSENEWVDSKAALLIAGVLMETLTHPISHSKVGVGFGGSHYSEKFAGLITDSEYAVGAIASKYALEHLQASVLRQMVEKCVEKVEYAFLDWKGLGAQKAVILSMLEELELEIVRV
ncbi:MAG: hypothetical protein HYU39_09120 [Thaumarchaeota archaeon]|nr:hypothetical protein [Nitrososphaerota archaeon]